MTNHWYGKVADKELRESRRKRMTSKWIEEIEQLVDNPDTWEFILPRLQVIDKLLRRAMFAADDEELFYQILKQTDKLNLTKVEGKIATGVSSVIPVTNEEAERIFNEVDDI